MKSKQVMAGLGWRRGASIVYFDSYHCQPQLLVWAQRPFRGGAQGLESCSGGPGSGSLFQLSCLPLPHPRRTLLKNVSSLAHRNGTALYRCLPGK